MKNLTAAVTPGELNTERAESEYVAAAVAIANDGLIASARAGHYPARTTRTFFDRPGLQAELARRFSELGFHTRTWRTYGVADQSHGNRFHIYIEQPLNQAKG
ncbi:MAG: hypothetical protein AAF658_01465 [Myxococcota bacterium]